MKWDNYNDAIWAYKDAVYDKTKEEITDFIMKFLHSMNEKHPELEKDYLDNLMWFALDSIYVGAFYDIGVRVNQLLNQADWYQSLESTARRDKNEN